MRFQDLRGAIQTIVSLTATNSKTCSKTSVALFKPPSPANPSKARQCSKTSVGRFKRHQAGRPEGIVRVPRPPWCDSNVGIRRLLDLTLRVPRPPRFDSNSIHGYTCALPTSSKTSIVRFKHREQISEMTDAVFQDLRGAIQTTDQTWNPAHGCRFQDLRGAIETR